MSLQAGAARFRWPSLATWAGVAGVALVLFAAAMVPLAFLAGGGSDVVTALVIGVPTAAWPPWTTRAAGTGPSRAWGCW
jgi:hypothetical protein